MNDTTFLITSEEAGHRLDRLLKDKWLPHLSRNRIHHLIQEQHILLNGRPARKGTILRHGDRLDLHVSEADQNQEILPDPKVSIEVLYEDAFLVALNKTAGMNTHPLQPNEKGTVANGLLSRYPEMQGIGFSPKEPGLVHRLDRDTSGILLAARKASAFEGLRIQFEQGLVSKVYLALVHGRLKERRGLIDQPIGSKSRRSPQVMVMASAQARPRGLRNVKQAETHFYVIRAFRGYSLVRLSMTSGVRHQLRAHMAYLGHPVVGDLLYGRDAADPAYGQTLARHLLHAAEIRFFHPDGGHMMKIRCRMPNYFNNIIDNISSNG